MTAVIELLTNVIKFFTDLFLKKQDIKENLWIDICATRQKLVVALEEGRVSDVAFLRKQLDVMLNEYRKGIRTLSVHKSSKLAKPTFLSVALTTAILCSGCASLFGKDETHTTVFVLGDRINIVEPDTTVYIPELIPPAKKWYLVDNVGLQHWLGIPTSNDTRTSEKQ